MRAGLYISLVLMILYFNIGYVWIVLGATLLTIFLDSQRETNEGFQSAATPFTPLSKQPKQYVWPTKDNPMTNVALTDYRNMPNRESVTKIAEADDPAMKKGMDDAFYSRIFRDVSDVYSTVATERNFYTMPVTTIPND